MAGYSPRWPALHVKFIDSDQTVELQPRDGDVVRLEEATGQSWSNLVAAGTWGMWVRLAWLVLRRQKDSRVTDDYEAFLDNADITVGDTVEEAPSEEGKAEASALVPPTGAPSNSHSSSPVEDSTSVLVSS